MIILNVDDSSSECTITIKNQLGHISNEESLRIANEIDEKLQQFFIKEVVQETETNVIPVERKGLNLFHPYLSNIDGLRTIISVKTLKYHPYIPLKYNFLAVFTLGSSNILLTDAVATGSEARKILHGSIFKSKYLGGFKKVCGYLALKSALIELEAEFPNIEFKFLKIVETIEEYDDEHKKIIYVYQKRMEPIDEEHKFIIADIKPEFDLSDIKSKITGIIRTKYGTDFELLDNDLGIDSKANFTVYLNDPRAILQRILKIRLQDGEEIEKIAIRFKFSSLDSKLRIMVLSMPHLNKETRRKYLRRLFLSSCNRNLLKKKCKFNILLKFLMFGDQCAVCAECVDVNISELILKDLYSSISTLGLLKVS
jgi:hypothetical protein